MKGINQRIEGDKLILEIDLTQNFGESSTGRSITIASTEGFQKLEERPGVSFSAHVSLSKRHAKKTAPAPATQADDGIEEITI